MPAVVGALPVYFFMRAMIVGSEPRDWAPPVGEVWKT